MCTHDRAVSETRQGGPSPPSEGHLDPALPWECTTGVCAGQSWETGDGGEAKGNKGRRRQHPTRRSAESSTLNAQHPPPDVQREGAGSDERPVTREMATRRASGPRHQRASVVSRAIVKVSPGASSMTENRWPGLGRTAAVDCTCQLLTLTDFTRPQSAPASLSKRLPWK